MLSFETIAWCAERSCITIVDQRALPETLVYLDLASVDDVCSAIQTLAVRGAPAIGICGALGVALAADRARSCSAAEFAEVMRASALRIRNVRPTAVNLAWAVDRVMRAVLRGTEREETARLALGEALEILHEDRTMCAAIGEYGATLLSDGMRVLTHCNAGALATGGIGTALAPIYTAHRRGVGLRVYADETRPLLQGSRLTAWELSQVGVSVTVIADSMAASLMQHGAIDCCIVGADRIAANGDTANKIGTYALAVLAKHHGIPFYVAAPSSTIDPQTPSGAAIAIEQRAAAELTLLHGRVLAPAAALVHNPAFDVTPAALVTAFVTDQGIHRPPFSF